MNKIVASVGLVALGASSLSAMAQDLGAPVSRPWSVGATLRGFYDDNINTTHDNRVDSFGIQVAPEVGVKWSGQATSVVAKYVYVLNWYDQKPAGDTSQVDSTHRFDALVNHQFNERFQIAVNDSFVIGQEPDTLRVPTQGVNTAQRVPGNNIRNYGGIIFTAQITPVFGAEAGYANTYVNYEGTYNSVLNADPDPGDAAAIIASPSGALDRMEHNAHIDARWNVKPTTVFLVGYAYNQTLYTGDETISGILFTDPFPPFGTVTNSPMTSSERDSRSHIGYVGVEHMFRPEFRGSLRLGAQFTTFYNLPTAETQTSPYVDGSLTYTYAQESHVNAGMSFKQSPTDVTDGTLNSDTFVLYASLRHRIVPNLFGNVLATFQNSSFNGGSQDGEADQYYQLGLNLQYVINRYLSTEIGYNYDATTSETPAREYNRNRVYIGLTAGY